MAGFIRYKLPGDRPWHRDRYKAGPDGVWSPPPVDSDPVAAPVEKPRGAWRNLWFAPLFLFPLAYPALSLGGLAWAYPAHAAAAAVVVLTTIIAAIVMPRFFPEQSEALKPYLLPIAGGAALATAGVIFGVVLPGPVALLAAVPILLGIAWPVVARQRLVRFRAIGDQADVDLLEEEDLAKAL